MEHWGAYRKRHEKSIGGLIESHYAFPAPVEQYISSVGWRRRLREGEHISFETMARRR